MPAVKYGNYITIPNKESKPIHRLDIIYMSLANHKLIEKTLWLLSTIRSAMLATNTKTTVSGGWELTRAVRIWEQYLHYETSNLPVQGRH